MLCWWANFQLQIERHVFLKPDKQSFLNRNSKSRPFRWRQELRPDEIAKVETACVEALSLWGYNNVAKHDGSEVLGPGPFS